MAALPAASFWSPPPTDSGIGQDCAGGEEEQGTAVSDGFHMEAVEKEAKGRVVRLHVRSDGGYAVRVLPAQPKCLLAGRLDDPAQEAPGAVKERRGKMNKTELANQRAGGIIDPEIWAVVDVIISKARAAVDAFISTIRAIVAIVAGPRGKAADQESMRTRLAIVEAALEKVCSEWDDRFKMIARHNSHLADDVQAQLNEMWDVIGAQHVKSDAVPPNIARSMDNIQKRLQ